MKDVISPIGNTSTLPFTLPVTLERSLSGGVTLPLTLPITFSYSSGVTLPFTLPVTFGPRSGATLPFTLPVTFTSGMEIERKIIIPTREYVLKAGTNTLRIPTRETSWIFYGLIFEENIVAAMNKPLTIIEEIRSRILVDVSLMNRTNVIVKWYGDKVPGIEVYKKMPVDEKWELVGNYTWEDETAVVDIGNNEYEILVKGASMTGESDIITIGESNYVNVNSNVNISSNEKVYSFDIAFNSKYTINVNY